MAVTAVGAGRAARDGLRRRRRDRAGHRAAGARTHGVEYLIATVLLGGPWSRWCSGSPDSARLDAVHPALGQRSASSTPCAILIFPAQVHASRRRCRGAVYPLPPSLCDPGAVLLPGLTRAVPAPLVAIVLLAVLAAAGAVDVTLPSGEGELPDQPAVGPVPRRPDDLATRCGIIAPYALALGAGRPDGVADDRQARRRHHRHPLQQDPRGARARAAPTSSPASSAAWAAAR